MECWGEAKIIRFTTRAVFLFHRLFSVLTESLHTKILPPLFPYLNPDVSCLYDTTPLFLFHRKNCPHPSRSGPSVVSANLAINKQHELHAGKTPITKK